MREINNLIQVAVGESSSIGQSGRKPYFRRAARKWALWGKNAPQELERGDGPVSFPAIPRPHEHPVLHRHDS